MRTKKRKKHNEKDYSFIIGGCDGISEFSEGIAIACIGKSQWDPDAVWIYIDKNNNQVLQSVKLP